MDDTRDAARVSALLGAICAAVVVSPGVASAAGTAFEAEVGNLTGTMSLVTDASACGGSAVAAGNTTNSVNIGLTLGSAGTYVLWMRVKAPATSQRAAWVAVDASGVFQDPQDLFDIQGTASGDYSWQQVTRRGSGTSSAPEADPRLLVLAEGSHSLEVRLRETDLTLDRLVLTSWLGYAPVACEAYSEEPASDGGPSAGDSDVGGDVDRLEGLRAADCVDGQYYDVARGVCLSFVEPSRCAAIPAVWGGGLAAVLLLRGRRARRVARRW